MKQIFPMCLALATAFGASVATAQQHEQHHGSSMMSNAPASPGSREMQQGMMSGMRHMQVMPMTGDVDKDFVRMMRQHHLQGIEMARIEAQKGDDPEAKRMARKIIDEQQKDIARFDDWLRKNQ
jgi:uncharacterized protein (DUF305 family)